MDITLELSVLLIIAILGQSIFGVFEVETPAWRKVFKWAVVCGITIALARVAGHWSLAIPVLGGVIGVLGHTAWCRRHGIDPLRATPRRRYYELRGWPWPE